MTMAEKRQTKRALTLLGKAQKVAGRGERVIKELAHQGYFVLVALESDKLYRWVAFFLFGVGIFSYIIHHFGGSEAIPTQGEKDVAAQGSVEED